MRTSQDQLEQIKNLIDSNFKQDAAQLLRRFLQQEPTNRQAWLLLSELTSGPAKMMCLKKAAACPPAPKVKAAASPKPAAKPSAAPIADVTIPYAGFAGVRAKARQKAAPIRPQNQPVAPVRPAAQPAAAASAAASYNTNERDFSLGRWLTIGLAGVVLGCIGVFILSRFAPADRNRQANAQIEPKAPLVPAVVETATPVATVLSTSLQDSPAVTPDEVAQINPSATPEPTAQQLAAKPVSENGAPRAAWTPTPTPTPTATPTPTLEPTRLSNLTSFVMPTVGDEERWVDVNLTLQTLTAYVGIEPVYQTLISSGRPPYYTVTGQFRVYYRLEEQTMDGRQLGFDYVTPGVPHVQYFYGDFAIHGATWHNDFGTPVSHGCVNVTPEDAKWLYTWMSYGTLVSVHY